MLGAGVWALDNENYDMWDYYKDALNEIPYESEKEIEIRKEVEARAAMLANMPFECPEILSYEIKHKYSIEIRKNIEEKSSITMDETEIDKLDRIVNEEIYNDNYLLRKIKMWLKIKFKSPKTSPKQANNLINLMSIIKSRTLVVA